MEQLLALVQEKTGIDADKARTAVETVLGFLKDKLPAPIASQIDGVIGGGGMPDVGGAGDALGGVTDKLGGMFGKKDD